MNIKKIVIAVALITAAALFFYLDLQRFLTLEALKGNRQTLLDYYAAHKVIMVAGFMTIYSNYSALCSFTFIKSGNSP